MRTTLLSITVISAVGLALSASSKAEETVRTAEYQQVTVRNVQPLSRRYRNSTRTFQYGEQCDIEPKGTLTKIGEVTDEGRPFYLVRYDPPKESLLAFMDSEGCPADTLFLITPTAFRKMTPTQNKERDREQQLRQQIERLQK